jgi:hypothetical protein
MVHSRQSTDRRGNMKGIRALNGTLGGLGASVLITLALATAAFASVEDSRFAISADRATVDFDVRNVARREILRRLFADSGISLDWWNQSFAEELISGTFQGPPSRVAGQLLSQADFVIVYRLSEERPEISRLIILGPAATEQAAAKLSAIDAAMRPSSVRHRLALVAPPDDAVAPPLVPPADATAPSLVPVSTWLATLLVPVVGIAAPRLTPPSPGEAALPLAPAPTEGVSRIAPKESGSAQ